MKQKMKNVTEEQLLDYLLFILTEIWLVERNLSKQLHFATSGKNSP
jgi:hypothetical protein